MKPIHWRRTALGKYLRHLPRPKQFRGTWLHRCCGDRLLASELWTPTRQRFAAGLAVGAFFAMIPVPFQMLAAALIAYITRVNIPIAVAATWISNPFSYPVVIYAQYRLGCFILSREPIQLHGEHLLGEISKAPVPYFTGVFPSAAILALVLYPITLKVWDWGYAWIHAAKVKREAAQFAKKAAPASCSTENAVR
jgi:uncharacterized protein (DUF2062 family)